jgi:hypothetical protein
VQTQTTQAPRAPLFRNRNRRFWLLLVAVAVLIVFYLPSLVAFRYTAAAQNTSFLTHPWRSWSFIATALTVPGDSRLKTSGIALRRADNVLRGSAVDPHEVRLLFLKAGRPYTFTHRIGGRTLTTTIRPPYRFVWQVSGHIDGVGGPDTIVAMLDYRSGRWLYDVRHDLPASASAEPASGSATTPSPSATP